MVHWKGMLGLVRLRMLRAPISKYSTGAPAGPLASSRLLWAAILAMPISSGIPLFSLFLRYLASWFRGASFSMKEALKRELCSRYVHGTSGRHFETDFPDQVVECLANGKVELIQRAGAGQGEQTISGIGVDHAGG